MYEFNAEGVAIQIWQSLGLLTRPRQVLPLLLSKLLLILEAWTLHNNLLFQSYALYPKVIHKLKRNCKAIYCKGVVRCTSFDICTWSRSIYLFVYVWIGYRDQLKDLNEAIRYSNMSYKTQIEDRHRNVLKSLAINNKRKSLNKQTLHLLQVFPTVF